MPPKTKVTIKIKKIKPQIKLSAAAQHYQDNVQSHNKNSWKEIQDLPAGTYLIKFKDGTTQEVALDGVNNWNRIKNDVGSDSLDDFFNGNGFASIVQLLDDNSPELTQNGISQTQNMNLAQSFLRAVGSDIPGVSHCVGKDGLCRKLRIKAQQYYMEHKVDKPYGKGQLSDNERYLRGTKRAYYRKLLKMANTLENLFFTEYPEGCTVQQLEQVCTEYKLKGTIYFPYFKEYYYINRELVRPLISFQFNNVAKDHVEIVLDGTDIQIVKDDEFDDLLENSKVTKISKVVSGVECKDVRQNMLKIFIKKWKK
jgi:hypothetical protein